MVWTNRRARNLGSPTQKTCIFGHCQNCGISWQCQDFHGFCYSHPSLSYVLLSGPLLCVHLIFRRCNIPTFLDWDPISSTCSKRDSLLDFHWFGISIYKSTNKYSQHRQTVIKYKTQGRAVCYSFWNWDAKQSTCSKCDSVMDFHHCVSLCQHANIVNLQIQSTNTVWQTVWQCNLLQFLLQFLELTRSKLIGKHLLSVWQPDGLPMKRALVLSLLVSLTLRQVNAKIQKSQIIEI